MIVQGDSLAVGMRPYIRAESYDARVGRRTDTGVMRLHAQHIAGKIVLISLGTNDLGRSARWMEHEARAVRALRPRCIVWGEINVRGTTLDDRLNVGLRAAKVRLVRAVAPGPDGVHPRDYRVLARRFKAAAQGC